MALRKILVNLLVVIAAITGGLVVVEVGFRIASPQKHFAVTVNTWDKDLGTRQIPGSRGFVVCSEYAIDLVINSRGLRDREFTYAKPDDTRRILCLGDSFTCGYGVEADETFAKVLERLLNGDDDRDFNWEVLNAGVGSTGTAHHLAFFASEGHRYNPDIVLLCFFQQNDFWDNITCGLYSIEEDELVKHEAPLTTSRRIQRYVDWIPGYNTLFARSHLLNFIKLRVARHHYRELAEDLTTPKDASALQAAQEELTGRLLLALRDSVADHGGCLVVTVIPLSDTWDLYDETLELVDHLETEGIPVIDLAPTLRAGAGRGLRIHYRGDQHWTSDGHRLAAQAMYEFIVDRPDI